MNKKIENLFKGDKVIWMIFFILCLVSIVEVFSASSFLTYKGGSYWFPVLKHTFFILLGIGAMLCVLNVPCKYFKIVTFPLLIVSVVMLLVVLFFGQSTNGASRWMGIAGIQFQPSEIAKGALVLAVAQILSAMQTDKGADRQAFWWVLGTSAFIILPIFFENFSTAFLLSAVVFLMMFVARVPLAQLGKLLGVVILGGVLAVSSIMALGQTSSEMPQNTAEKVEYAAGSKKGQPDNEAEKKGGLLHRFDTWKSRIEKFTSSDDIAPDEYDLDKDAQVAHANIAIVKSQGIGCGPGNSEERDFISQAFSDFIFAIIIEELGLWGAAVIASLYVIIFWRAGHIARNCANTFPAYLSMGIGMLLVIQAMFNMLVAVGLAPVTGQPLPLVSKGGTSTIINCVYIGMLLSISKSAKKRQPSQKAHV
ncbi:MAG: FtsW/RodA/SpoVE family cell cycle protein [Bacteroidales bacterium]|nr:FtsW/RodA/SpoVE family cell cycle protein [Bacteroidales bacterium]MCM1146897.1 FtsW/RodA/SpoVE family cell cycle protein [Bacteroidales bacterium]MCM1205605.1 FtsW/RodA/SpoVE family cell cycle protein [Bacillota bacterium]MCM1510284.1 FtsW/RodA/SpoVE family cell cycle protein [Clostridium sp.]